MTWPVYCRPHHTMRSSLPNERSWTLTYQAVEGKQCGNIQQQWSKHLQYTRDALL